MRSGWPNRSRSENRAPIDRTVRHIYQMHPVLKWFESDGSLLANRFVGRELAEVFDRVSVSSLWLVIVLELPASQDSYSSSELGNFAYYLHICMFLLPIHFACVHVDSDLSFRQRSIQSSHELSSFASFIFFIPRIFWRWSREGRIDPVDVAYILRLGF